MKWKDPYCERPKSYSWIIYKENDVGYIETIKTFYTGDCGTDDNKDDIHYLHICQWPIRFVRYIYMSELAETLTDPKYHSDHILKARKLNENEK